MNAPTLLVGLGGKGSQIVQKVYERATPNQRENISFVVFDTDVNELRVIAEQTPQIRTIQTSTRLTVGEYLEIDQDSRDTWFPVNRILNSKALTEGAGQVRAVSRLALNTAIQQGRMAPLNEAIEDLYKLNGASTTQAPRVIITGSLCGGTGSGLILPVSLYIRNFMSTKLQQGSAIIRGFFLLPEVFDGVIKVQSERNNLRSNAYAAVREIDAFMMKDDGSLPERYNLEFSAPRAGSQMKEVYSGRPMDFCFLFDGQNLNGMKLNSHADYVEHAANCIYGMAIAPTSRRSNSSEDNVIREIVLAGGRNRFAGAGSAMLIYPTDDVKKYLALQWTRESITGEWLEIDKVFDDELKTNRKMRAKGLQVPELNRGNHYIDVVKNGYAQQHSFESAIRNMCYEYDSEGFEEKGINWDQYKDNLESFINSRIKEQQESETVAQLVKTLKIKNKEDKADGDDTEDGSSLIDYYESWYRTLQTYKNATTKITQMVARNIAYTLFKEAKDYTNTDDMSRIEFWLHKNRNRDEFIHPNAVRFFLYNALNIFKKEEAERREKTNDIEKFWNDFEKNTFDIKETKDHQETESEFYEASRLGATGIKRLLSRSTIAQARDKLDKNFKKYYANTTEYWTAYVYREVYREAIQYISSVCDSFHGFYDVLERNVGKLNKEIEQLEKKYEVKDGQARRYVCADEKCLKGLASEVVNKKSSIDFPSDLSRVIYQKMKSFALAEKKPAAEDYFIKVFNDTIVGYLEEQIMDQYSSVVDMDIISALEKECHFINSNKVIDRDDEQLYAKHIIQSTEILAKPFIEAPLGKEPRVIPACAFNPELLSADIPDREDFVKANLVDNGGIGDDSIDRNMILFYQGVYDLRANELSKFAPPRKATTFDRQGGEYFKAYHELIEQINPETVRSKVITPHLDRWWHIISKMPELDEDCQEEEERRICAGFFWGMLTKVIMLGEEGTHKSRYVVDKVRLDVELDDGWNRLIVSNGTACDHLYEVLDSFTIYPQLVKIVLDKVKERTDIDIYRQRSLEESVMLSYIKHFRLEEFPLEKGEQKDAVRSVFELPLLMKRSVPSEEYQEDAILRLTETILSEMKQFLARFCSIKELPGAYANLVKDQFSLMLENVQADKRYSPMIAKDSLFKNITKKIVKVFEEMEMDSVAYDIDEMVRAFDA